MYWDIITMGKVIRKNLNHYLRNTFLFTLKVIILTIQWVNFIIMKEIWTSQNMYYEKAVEKFFGATTANEKLRELNKD